MAEKKKNVSAPAMEETLNKHEALILKYKNAIIGAIVALVVIVAGVSLYKNYVSGPAEAKASTALGKAQQLFMEQKYEQALNGDSTGVAGLLSIASEYSSTDAGNLANLYAGLCFARQEKADWKQALQYLKEYEPSKESLIGAFSQFALGNAYANNDQLDDAVNAFKKAAELADNQAEGVNNSIAPRALIEAGIILEKQGKKAEANEIYVNVKKTYVASPAFQEIDKYIERTK